MTGEMPPKAPQELPDGRSGERPIRYDLRDDMVLRGLRRALDEGHISCGDYKLYSDAYMIGYSGDDNERAPE